MIAAKPDSAGITGGKPRPLPALAAVPHRADRMDHMLGRQPVTLGELGVTSFAAAERAAFLEERWAGGPVDCTVNPATTEKRRVGGVDDGIDAQGRDVGDDDFEPHI